MDVHDPFCPYYDARLPSACRCALIVRVRAAALRDVATAWQWNGWTVITDRVKARSVLGTAQIVTDWLWERANKEMEGSDERERGLPDARGDE